MTNQVTNPKINIDIPRMKIFILLGFTALIIFVSIGALFVYVNTTFTVILVLIAAAFPVTLFLKSKYRVSISFIFLVGALLFSMFASQDLIQTNIIHAGPIGLRLEDILLLVALFLSIIEGLFLNTLIISKSKTSFFLFTFICWHIICVGISQVNGIPLRDAIYESRPFIYLYTSFFITINWNYYKLSKILLVNFLILFGFILSIFAIRGFLFTFEQTSLFNFSLGDVRQVDSFSSGYAYSLIVFLLCYSLISDNSIKGLWRLFIYLTLLLSFIAVIVSFTRGLWLGLVVGILANEYIYFKKYNQFAFFKVRNNKIFVFLIISILFVSVLSFSDFGKQAIKIVANRLLSTPDTLISQSRIPEAEVVIKEIVDSPIWGKGFGSQFTYQHYWLGPITTNYVHNTYLYVGFKMGMVGLFFFLIIWVSYLSNIYRVSISTDREVTTWVYRAFWIITLAFLAVGMTSPFILAVNYSLFFGFMLGSLTNEPRTQNA